MKLGLHINDFAWPIDTAATGSTIREIAQTAEAAGFDAIAVMDHVWQHPMMRGPEQPVLECYATLAYLAAHTARVKLLALATPPSYRVPAMLAKSVTTVDVLSSGRAWLGVGAGDYDDEARGLGIPFPSLSERYELLEGPSNLSTDVERERGDERPLRVGTINLSGHLTCRRA